MESSINVTRAFRLRKRTRYLISGLLVMVAIGAASLLPESVKRLLHTTNSLHSSLHVLAFAALSFLSFRGVRSQQAHLLLVCAGLLLAVTTEFSEHRIYGSPLEYVDIVADGLGVGLGSGIASILRRRRTRKSVNKEDQLKPQS